MRVLILGCKDYPAFATPWVHGGGMEVYVERMVRSLADRARFTIWTAGGKPAPEAEVVPLGGARGLRTQPVSLLARSLAKLRTRPAADVLNPQTPLAGLAALWAERRWKIPYVVTVHIFAAEPSHTGSRSAARAYGAVERLVFSRASAIVPTGRRLGEAIAARHPRAAGKIRPVTAAAAGIVPTAPREAVRDRLSIDRLAPCLLFLGRIVLENYLTELVEALHLLRQRRRDVVLLVAGSGNREREVGERIKMLGLESAVRRLGGLHGQEKLDVLGASDLMVRTSRHEVFPEAYLEALSVGTPVAATPAGDTPDLAEASGAIALLPFGDHAAQAEILGDLLGEPQRLAGMRDRALEFSRRVTWNDRKNLYWQILEHAAHVGGGSA